MKKIIPSFIAAAVFLATGTAIADPLTNNISFVCPAANVLSNFGGYIAGYGTENTLGQSFQVYFKTTQYPSGVPDALTNYSNAATTYDMANGYVTCSFSSSNSSESNFDVSYYVTNGKGGLIQNQDVGFISIDFPVGLTFRE